MFTLAHNVNVFSEFRLIYGTVLILVIVHLALSIWQSGSQRSSYTLMRSVVNSVILIIFSGILFIAEKNTVTNHQLVPDQLAFYLFLAIVILAIIAPMIYAFRQSRSGRRRYHY